MFIVERAALPAGRQGLGNGRGAMGGCGILSELRLMLIEMIFVQ